MESTQYTSEQEQYGETNVAETAKHQECWRDIQVRIWARFPSTKDMCETS